MNSTEFATLKIYEYVDGLFTCLSDLLHPQIEELMNNQAHGLNRKELITLLSELFSSYKLVAKKEGRGFFTPNLEEIKAALNETNDDKEKNIFYGLTTGAVEEYRELQRRYNIA